MWTAQAKADIRDIEPPLIPLRAQDHRVLFRDKGACLEVSSVLDRKEESTMCAFGVGRRSQAYR